MSDGLKQRLIGAVVLIALAIILWPFVSGQTPEPAALSKTVIKEPPPFKPFEIPEPAPAHDVPDVGEYQRKLRVRQQQNAAAKVTKTAAASVAKPAAAGLDEHGLPVAWVVQVGSFSKATNAISLMATLQQQGYHAATQQRTTDEGTFTRVFIGPTVDQARAQKIIEAIRKSYPHARLERFVPPTDGFRG